MKSKESAFDNKKKKSSAGMRTHTYELLVWWANQLRYIEARWISNSIGNIDYDFSRAFFRTGASNWKKYFFADIKYHRRDTDKRSWSLEGQDHIVAADDDNARGGTFREKIKWAANRVA